MFPQDTTRIAIMLGSSMLILVVAFFSLNTYLTPRYVSVPTPIDINFVVALPPEPMLLVLTVALLVICSILLAAGISITRTGRAKLTPEEQQDERMPIFPPHPPFP